MPPREWFGVWELRQTGEPGYHALLCGFFFPRRSPTHFARAPVQQVGESQEIQLEYDLPMI